MNNYDEFLKAKELIKKRNYRFAFEILEKLLEEEPYDRFIKFELAKILTKLNKKDKARIYFKELLNTQNREYAMLELGRLEASEGNIKEARNYFEKLLNTQNRNYAMLELGRLEASEGNIKEARNCFEKLLNTQNREYAMLELGRLEASEGNIKEARNYFEKLLNNQSRNYAIMELLSLNIQFEKYEDALLYLEMLTQSNSISLKVIKQYQFYIKYKLGKIDYSESINGYFNKQLVSYDREEAIQHIKLHLDENDEKSCHTTFFDKICINSLFKLVQENLNKMEKRNYGICDKYIFDVKYPIGEINGIETTLVEIVTICNTYNIITMYPVMLKSNDYCNSKKLKYKL